MPTYQTPGVYIKEVPGQMKPIEGVATSVAAFIGLASGGPVNTPTKVTSWAQYQRLFGDPVLGAFRPDAFMPYAVQGFFMNGGNNAWIIRVGKNAHGGRPFAQLPNPDGVSAFEIVAHPDALERAEAIRNAKTDDDAVREKNQSFRLEIGVKVVNDPGDPKAEPPVGPSITVTATSNLPAQKARGAQDADQKVEPPEEHKGLTIAPGTRGFVSTVNAASKLIQILPTGGLYTSTEMAPADFDETIAEAADLPTRDSLLPSETATTNDLKGNEMRQTGLPGLALADEVTMVCVPDLHELARGDDAQVRDVQTTLDAFCANTKRMAIHDPPPGLTSQEVEAWRDAAPSSPFSTLYWPWLDVLDAGGKPIHIPPCGHVAGVWARTDGTRGVHKAPANEEIRGTVGLGFDVDAVAQGSLNAAGINCIRSFKGRGTRIWGARTLSSDNEYLYVNVRRLINYISASLLNGTQWSVFEPNDEILWGQLSVSVSAFLNGVWRSGALFGSTPDEAYFVKCDADTNPPELVAIGQVNVHVGVAPVKPAEFVIFQISQFQPGAA